jgi:hypothetical protein
VCQTQRLLLKRSHATIGYLFAIVLSQIVLEKHVQLFARDFYFSVLLKKLTIS